MKTRLKQRIDSKIRFREDVKLNLKMREHSDGMNKNKAISFNYLGWELSIK